MLNLRWLVMNNVTRLEVIDGEGRSYVNYGVGNIEFSLQDEGRTLKIFITQSSGKDEMSEEHETGLLTFFEQESRRR